MKKIIEGKKYDTETARLVIDNNPDYNAIHWDNLYRKKNGEFFWCCWTRMQGEKASIIPVTESQAKKEIGRYDGDLYEELFGEVEE